MNLVLTLVLVALDAASTMVAITGSANPRALPAAAAGPLAPRPGERRAAVERILEVELERLKTAVELNVAKLSLPEHLRKAAPTTDEIVEEARARAPMLRWAINRWLIESLGTEKFGVWCPTLKKLELHPWQWTPKGHPTLTPPTLVESLIALRPQLTEEILNGFKSFPLRACRLAYRAAVVYALAMLQNLPGPQSKLIQRTWPRLVEHLAMTMELNHEKVLTQGLSTEQGPAWLQGPRKLMGQCSRVGDGLMLRWETWRGRGTRHLAYD